MSTDPAQTSNFVLQTLTVAHADRENKRWQERWAALTSVIEETQTMVESTLTQARVEVERSAASIQRGLDELKIKPQKEDLERSSGNVLTWFADFLIDPASAPVEGSEDTFWLLLIAGGLLGDLVPKQAAYQMAMECRELLERLLDFSQAIFRFFDEHFFPDRLSSAHGRGRDELSGIKQQLGPILARLKESQETLAGSVSANHPSAGANDHSLTDAPASTKEAMQLAQLAQQLAEIAWQLAELVARSDSAAPAVSGRQTALSAKLAQVTRAADFGSERYSCNYVFATLLEQISIDLTLIKQAFHERYSEQTYRKREDRELPGLALVVADMLAQKAMQPAIERGFFDKRYKAIRTYSNRRVEVRLLPYHDFVFVGIPHSAQPSFFLTLRDDQQIAKVLAPTDFLAIPHEIGHHLYRYGQLTREQEKAPVYQMLQSELRDRLAAQPEELQRSAWRQQWLEEIFADTYGCLVAGPVTVLGFQEYLANGHPTYFNDHDGKHPITVLRPLIQSQILRSISDRSGRRIYGATADQLDERWQRWVKEQWPYWVDRQWPYGYGAQSDILRGAIYEIEGRAVTGQTILEELQLVIDVCLEILRPASQQATWTPNWQPDRYAGPEQISRLYESFAVFTFVETLRTSIQTYFELQEQAGEPEKAESLPYAWLLAQLDHLQKERPRGPLIDRLVDLILFEGWSTEGPQSVGGR